MILFSWAVATYGMGTYAEPHGPGSAGAGFGNRYDLWGLGMGYAMSRGAGCGEGAGP